MYRSISVSLNAENAETYNKVCRPPFDGAYEGLKAFIIEAKKHIAHVTASIVGLPSVDVEKCGKSRILLGGLAGSLHEQNLQFMYNKVREEEETKIET